MDQARTSDKPEVKLHFLDYWRVVRMRKSLILTVFLLVVITTTVMTFWLLPEKYASCVRVEVKKDMPEIAITESSYGRDFFDPYFLQTQFEIIKSTAILNAVITNLDLCSKFARQLNEPNDLTVDDAYDVLSRRIKVEQKRSTTLVEISVYDSDKVQAAQIANKIAEMYKVFREGSRNQKRQLAIQSLRTQIEQNREKLLKAEDGQYQFLTNSKMPILEENFSYTGTIFAETLRRLEAQRLEAQDTFITSSNLLAKILEIPSERRKNALPALLPIDGSLAALHQDLANAEQRFVQASGSLGTNHPEYITVKKVFETVQRQLNDKVNDIIEGVQQRVKSDAAKLQILEAKVEEASAQSGQKSELYRPYMRLKRDVESRRGELEKLEGRLMNEEAEVTQPNESVRVIDMAKAGLNPVSPNKPLNLALGIVVGLIVGIGLAFFIEYLDTSVKTIDDVERALEAPVLAVIPQQVGVLMEEGLDSPHAEAYRVLRTNMLFARKDETWNTVTVLSGGAGEGKSTTLFNLATVFAQAGSRVLVIDSDLNRPSIHKMLHVSNNIGLTDCLLNKHKLEEVIQTTSQANLDFMPSGKLPRTSMGILSSNQMKELIKEVKSRYDYVFFDSPPLLGVSDASVLASLMDMTLQVIQYRRYPQLMTIRAKQMILKVGGHLMGIVLNNINMSQDENYYYYSGYYEYKSKQKDTPEVKGDKPGDDSAKKKADGEIKQKY